MANDVEASGGKLNRLKDLSRQGSPARERALARKGATRLGGVGHLFSDDHTTRGCSSRSARCSVSA
jgi:hypothetical protein